MDPERRGVLQVLGLDLLERGVEVGVLVSLGDVASEDVPPVRVDAVAFEFVAEEVAHAVGDDALVGAFCAVLDADALGVVVEEAAADGVDAGAERQSLVGQKQLVVPTARGGAPCEPE